MCSNRCQGMRSEPLPWAASAIVAYDMPRMPRTTGAVKASRHVKTSADAPSPIPRTQIPDIASPLLWRMNRRVSRSSIISLKSLPFSGSVRGAHNVHNNNTDSIA